MLAKQSRFVCPDCQLQYRLESDFLEHGRVGCRMKNSDRPTFSDKDVEETGDISAAVEQALGEVVVDAVVEQPEEKPADKPTKASRKKQS